MYVSDEKRLWVVTVPNDLGSKPRSLIFYQKAMPSSEQVYDRAGVDRALRSSDVLPIDLTAAMDADATNLSSFDEWARDVLEEGLAVRPLIEVPAAAFKVKPAKRVHYGTKEQYLDEGGCLQGEVHYDASGKATRWLVDSRFAAEKHG